MASNNGTQANAHPADTHTLMADQPHTLSIGRLAQPDPERQPLLVDLDSPEAGQMVLDATALGY